MEKPKGKAKKRNVETGLLMGQNTNVFSQLSASLLQTRTNNTEEEQRFLNNTPVVQYHDPEVNRLLALLRKKAEVTKAKAAVELREVISKMGAQEVEEFISTFAHLYLQTVMNESSKVIVEEFVGMATDLLSAHRKIVITEISTLYPPLLITNKLSKLASLLFVGNEQELPKKTLVLLLKKDVSKKFLIMARLVLDCEALQNIPQPHMQRNCQALTKLLRDLMRIPSQELEEDLGRFFRQICNSFGKECIDEYFKVGGRAKASILELYASLVAAAARRPEWGLPWQVYAKAIGECFLDKDLLVQQALWKGSVHLWLDGLLEIEQNQNKEEEKGKILDIYLPKSEEKLLSCLGLGGFALYKELPRFCESFPWTILSSQDSHRQLVNKLNFFRKLMTQLLLQEDENEARMECYAALVRLLVGRVRAMQISGDEKKGKELHSLAAKFEKEAFYNLQERFYTEPPVSKNFFSSFIPQHFGQLLNDLQPDFEFKFHPELSYQLYHRLLPSEYAQRIQNELFQHSKTSQVLTLRYLETFSRREVQVDMGDKNSEVEIAAKIYLLSRDVPREGQAWMGGDWDIRKQLIVFDPRISQRDLQAQDEQEDNLYSLYFRPSHRSLLPGYDCPQLDTFRFCYFKETLFHPEHSHYIRYLLPFLSDILLPRNPHLADQLFSLFSEKCQMAATGNWTVSSHQVLIVRVFGQLLCDVLVRERSFQSLKRAPLESCLSSIAEFVRLLAAYKMERESEDVLRRIQGLLGVPDAKPFVLNSCGQALMKSWKQLLGGKLQGAEKVRRNRIKKCLQFTHRLLGIVMNSLLPARLATQFLLDEANWREAGVRSEPWHVLQAVMSGLTGPSQEEVLKTLLTSSKQHQLQLVLLLSAEVLLPLQALPELRTYFIELKGRLQKYIAKMTGEELGELLSRLVRRVMTEGVYELSEGLRGTIIFVLIEREDESAELLQQIKQGVLLGPFEEFVRPANNVIQTLIFNTIVSSIPLRRIAETEALGADLVGHLLKSSGEAFLILVSTTCLFWSKGVGAAEAMDSQYRLLTEMINRTLKEQPQTKSPLLTNFYQYVLFGLANTAVGLAGWPLLEQFLESIDPLFWEEGAKGQLDGLALSQKMRFASRAVLSREGPALLRLISQLPEVINRELDYFGTILQTIESEEEVFIQDSLVSLFVQSAQFLLRAAAFINEKQVPSEHTLLKLVQCSFPALRKASFLLLKAMYQAKLVSRELPNEFKTILATTLKGEVEGELGKEAVSYFYCWQLVLLRRQSTQRAPEGEEELPLSLDQILQPDGLTELLLRNCFWVIEERLDYLKREGDFTVYPEQLLEWDPERDFLAENQPERRIFLLALRTFFLFVSSFPVNLRDIVDRFKRYRPVCERLLRNVVTEAIFRQEVARIEMLEAEWKQGGNLEVYVTTHNRQIYAQYCHQTIRIGLRLHIKSTYPLAPIVLSFGEGLKVEEGGRWGLMLQSQLQSRNSSVIRGILLWKENVDRRMGGVEECAICFDIVNTYGQLPKKGCKTCKKKFHGNCIMKWFSKSNKSECPLCKSQFL